MVQRSERRAFTRVPLAYRVRILTEEHTFGSSTALNLSLGGMLVQLPQPLPLGTRCHIVLFMVEDGEDQKILAEGIVVRSSDTTVAIRFTRLLGPQSRERLEHLILHRSPNPEAERKAFEAYLRNPDTPA